MALIDKCKEFGWHLSQEGIKQIVENGTSQDVKAIIKKALDYDLREISTPSFPEDIVKTKYDTIPGHLVVQVQKIRNISAPKANEESQGVPRMLKLSLTDGHTNCQAVEIEQIESLSLNTPPGTKIFLKTETLPMAHGYLLIGPEHVQVLGGNVSILIEKWELNRSLAKHVRGRVGEEGGPPPWIPFGQKILRANPQDRHFKSLESKDKENRGDSEFDVQRKDAIAEASRAGAKKVFGGGHKPLLDHNVQQIVDCGFSVEQAENALKQSRNNVDKALKNLQRSENRRGGGNNNNNNISDARNETKKSEESSSAVTSSTSSRKKGRERNVDDEIGQQKPSGRLSLFDFLEDKLPASVHTEKPEKSSNPSFEQRRNGPRGGGRGSRTNSGGGGGRSGGSRGKGSRNNNSNNNHNHQTGGSVGVWSSDTQAHVSNSSSNKHQLSTSSSTNSSSVNNHFHYNQHHPAHRGDDSKVQRYSTLSNSNSNSQQKPPRFQNQHQQYKQSTQHHHQQTSLGGFYNDSTSSNTSCNNTWNAFNNNALDNLTSNWPARYGSSSSPSGGPSTTSNSNNDLSSSANRIRTTQQMNSRSSVCSTTTTSAFGNNYVDTRVFNNQQDAIGQQPKVPKNVIGQGYVRTSNNTTHQHLLSDFANYNNKDSSTPNAFRGSLYQGVAHQTENMNTNNPSTHYLRYPGSNSQDSTSCMGLKQWVWSKGDKCMAKYWEDDRYYHAEVTGVSQRTCVVRFLDYGNFEEVLQDDCIPFSEGS